ncbi:MAG: hypothetical protein OEQ13_05290 [Acidobacteriota bacterium]|nr:hypothetical protein [Acidobacteriota bacterium]
MTPKTPVGWIFAVAMLLASMAGAMAARHYSGAHGLRLTAPNESWLHATPREQDAMYGEITGGVQDAVYFAGGNAEIVAWVQQLPMFASTEHEYFQRGFEETVREQSEHPVTRCSTVETDDTSWSCLEWLRPEDGYAVRHRIYLSGRGITKAFVGFTAPDPEFPVFGSPGHWLKGLEWLGPSLFHAM